LLEVCFISEGNKVLAEGKVLISEGNKVLAEGKVLISEGNKIPKQNPA